MTWNRLKNIEIPTFVGMTEYSGFLHFASANFGHKSNSGPLVFLLYSKLQATGKLPIVSKLPSVRPHFPTFVEMTEETRLGILHRDDKGWGLSSPTHTIIYYHPKSILSPHNPYFTTSYSTQHHHVVPEKSRKTKHIITNQN